MHSLNRRTVIWIFVAVIAGGALWAKVVEVVLDRNTPPPKQYLPPDPVPDFTLTECHGQRLARANLLGKIWVADLMFTSCPSTCPILSSMMAKLDQALGPREDIRLVSITVTPEYDQPPVLLAYSQRYHASPKWLFLTGERAQIVKLANDGFWLSAGAPGTVTHSDDFVLVDRGGYVRGIFDGTKAASIPQIQAAIERLH